MERVVNPGDSAKILLNSKQADPSKFKSEWFSLHKVVGVRGVVVTVKKISTGRVYNTHNDSSQI